MDRLMRIVWCVRHGILTREEALMKEDLTPAETADLEQRLDAEDL